jgi:dCTP deaminase
MILPDYLIADRARDCRMIEPFSRDQLEPASYDVKLGNDFMVFERDATPCIDLEKPKDLTKKVHIPDGEYFLLHPGEFILAVTDEYFRMPKNLVGRVEGKSSIGRLGLMVHVTAGYIDPGFSGNITLEMTCLHPLPIKLRPGSKIGQISFHQMVGPPDTPYQGRYQGADGIESSKYGQ